MIGTRVTGLHRVRNQAVGFSLFNPSPSPWRTGYREYRHGDWLHFRAVPVPFLILTVPFLILKGVMISSWETGILRPVTCES